MWSSTGSTSSTGPTISSGEPRTPHPIAQSPSATTRRGSGIAAYAVSKGVRIRVVTGPVTRRTSAWRGDATIPIPNRCRSVYGLDGEDQLVLAPVARAAVDVPNGEAAAAIRSRQGDLSTKAAEISEKGQHQRSAQA